MQKIFNAMMENKFAYFCDINGVRHTGIPTGINWEGGQKLWQVRYRQNNGEYKHACVRS